MKTGVLGGTFDPAHLGHIAVAEAALESLGLDEVVLIPAGQPVFKTARPVTAAEHRLRMLQLSVAGRQGLSVSAIEAERPGPSYTVETIAELRRRAGNGGEWYFIMGCDGFDRLAEWRDPSRLVEICRLAAVPRPGCALPDLAALEAAIPGITRRVTLLDGPYIDISASDIRRRAARGMSLRGLVAEPVAEYIGKNKIYRTQQEV